MADRVRVIRLYGLLGTRFGREFRLVVRNAAEAVHALSILIPGFRQYLLEANGSGMGFAVFYGRQNLSQDQLSDPPGDDVIRIAPVLQGAKRGGVLQIIAGAALVVGGFFFAQPAVVAAGWSMVAGGVVQLLAPSPRGLSRRESPGNSPSYTFSGAINTEAQGHPVPVAYGEVWTGSAVISAGIYAQDQV